MSIPRSVDRTTSSAALPSGAVMLGREALICGFVADLPLSMVTAHAKLDGGF